MLCVLIGRPTEALAGDDLPSDLQETLQAETAKTADYRALGLLREMWHFADYKGALLLCEVESLENAHAISIDYPMVRKGYITHEIHELISEAALKRPAGSAD